MTKKNINVTIEVELLKEAKEQIPNISSFFESCLRNYLNGTFPVSDANKILQQIGQLQADLYLLNQNNDVKQKIKDKENLEKDKAWRFLWNDYNTRLIPDDGLMEKAAVTEQDIPFTKDENGVHFTLPHLRCHALVALNY